MKAIIELSRRGSIFGAVAQQVASCTVVTLSDTYGVYMSGVEG